jgi:hypothetical protein
MVNCKLLVRSVPFACNLGGFEQMFWKLNWKNIWVITTSRLSSHHGFLFQFFDVKNLVIFLTLNRSKSSKIYTRKKSKIFPIFLLKICQTIVGKKNTDSPLFFILLNKLIN